MKNYSNIIFLVLAMAVFQGFSQGSSNVMPQMVHVEGGEFIMGDNNGTKDEQPAHKVTVTCFYFGKYEVTNMDFKRFVDATGYKTDAEQPDSVNFKHGLPPRGANNGTWRVDSKGLPFPASDSMKPVGNISWNDAVAYLNWLSKETGKQFRLPTEAEWAYAARGGNKSKGYWFAGGNNADEVAWYVKNSGYKSHNIGQKMPNELGIHDLSGNNKEWCSDWFGDTYYKVSPAADPKGPDHGKNRVMRGGSWGSDEKWLRISYRSEAYPYNSALDFGFRPALTDEEAVKKATEKVPEKTPEENILKDLDTKGFIDVYGIYFDVNKYKVKPESFAVIDQMAKYLQENPKMRIMIEGHTDNTGKDQANQALSEKRANAIKEELVRKGIDSNRLETIGYGAAKPIADNATPQGRTQNRRVTIKKL